MLQGWIKVHWATHFNDYSHIKFVRREQTNLKKIRRKYKKSILDRRREKRHFATM